MEPDSTVAIVDDDPSVRRALDNLLRAAGWRVAMYSSAREFLEAPRSEGPLCVVLDVRMPGLSGLDMQIRLASETAPPPIVFITGHGDIATAVRAMHQGAIEFLTKPFRDDDLLRAIHRGVEQHRKARDQARELSDLRVRWEGLTPREREVLVLVARGLANKEVAAVLGVTEATVKVHRGQVTRKMKALSVADLVKMSLALGLPTATGDGISLPGMP